MKRILYPIETTNRELDGVLLTALKLAASGHEAIIGPKVELNYLIDKLRPNVYISTRATDDHLFLFHKLQRSNVAHVVMDTEAGVFIDEYFRKRHHRQALATVDQLFVWGEAAKASLLAAGTIPAGKIGIAGAPWFDLVELRHVYDEDVARIQAEFKDGFILYNSHLAIANPKVEGVNKDAEKFSPDFEAYARRLFANMNDMLERLVRHFPEVQIVIRPHPSENPEYYRTRFSKYPNVSIRSEHNARSWIIASRLVLHNGCTTGIEAALLHKPVLSYREVQDDRYDMKVANESSLQVTSFAALTETVKGILNNDRSAYSDADVRSGLEPYFSNMRFSGSGALADYINNINGGKFRRRFYAPYLKKLLKHEVIFKHDRALRILPRAKRENLIRFRDYHFHKFKPFSLAQLQQKQAAIAKSNGLLARPVISALPGSRYSFRILPSA